MAKMKKINWKSKKTWKNALIIGLACITLVGAVVGLSTLFRKSEETTKEINPTYAVGGLTEQGRYFETEESIYTEDAFECQGLDIDLDFKSNISYRVFFYDSENEFLESTEKLISDFNKDVSPYAKTCRIVITPNEDDKISWYEKNGYANQLTIRVDKEQSVASITENLFVYDGDVVGKYYNGSTTNFTSSDGLGNSAIIDVSGYDKLQITMAQSEFYVTPLCQFMTSDGIIVETPNIVLTNNGGATHTFDVDVPNNATHFSLVYVVADVSSISICGIVNVAK